MGMTSSQIRVIPTTSQHGEFIHAFFVLYIEIKELSRKSYKRVGKTNPKPFRERTEVKQNLLWQILQNIVLEITMTGVEQKTEFTVIVVVVVRTLKQAVLLIIPMVCILQTIVQTQV
jgi:hypothetical protein